MTVLSVRVAGERAVVLDCGARRLVWLRALRELADRLDVRLVDVVPGAATVLVVAANPGHLQRFLDAVRSWIRWPPATDTGAVWRFPPATTAPILPRSLPQRA